MCNRLYASFDGLCLMSDDLADADAGLSALGGVFENVAVDDGGVLFEQQNDGRAAELKHTLLLSPFKTGDALAVADVIKADSAEAIKQLKNMGIQE